MVFIPRGKGYKQTAGQGLANNGARGYQVLQCVFKRAAADAFAAASFKRPERYHQLPWQDGVFFAVKIVCTAAVPCQTHKRYQQDIFLRRVLAPQLCFQYFPVEFYPAFVKCHDFCSPFKKPSGQAFLRAPDSLYHVLWLYSMRKKVTFCAKHAPAVLTQKKIYNKILTAAKTNTVFRTVRANRQGRAKKCRIRRKLNGDAYEDIGVE